MRDRRLREPVIALDPVEQRRDEPADDEDAEDHKAKNSDLVDILDGIPESALEIKFFGDLSDRERSTNDDCNDD